VEEERKRGRVEENREYSEVGWRKRGREEESVCV